METDLLQNKSAKGSPWKVPSLNFCFLWMTGGNWMHPCERTWLFCEKPRFLSRFPAGYLFCFIISTLILLMKNKERRGSVKLRVAIIERVSDHVRMGMCACFPIFSSIESHSMLSEYSVNVKSKTEPQTMWKYDPTEIVYREDFCFQIDNWALLQRQLVFPKSF